MRQSKTLKSYYTYCCKILNALFHGVNEYTTKTWSVKDAKPHSTETNLSLQSIDSSISTKCLFFFIFDFQQFPVNRSSNKMPMTSFEPGSSGIGNKMLCQLCANDRLVSTTKRCPYKMEKYLI